MSTLTAAHALSVSSLKGIGPAMAEKLSSLGISTLLDLLFHLPLRYQDRTRIKPIVSLRNGQAAVIQGDISVCNIQFGKRRSMLCKIQDGSGTITLRFFHFSAMQKNQLSVGSTVRCFGEASLGRGGLEIIHPEYQIITDNQTLPVPEYLTAIYPSTDGIHQIRWRNFIQAAFQKLDPSQVLNLIEPEDFPLPDLPVAKNLYLALQLLHYPPPDVDLYLLSEGLHPVQRRLAFEELVAQRISHLALKQRNQKISAAAIKISEKIESRFIKQLPFQLTNEQVKVLDEIKTDIATTTPMMRLLQGDVGSGKTVVAALTALHCINDGQQVALMAPREILAEQHALTFASWLKPFNISVSLLVSKMSAANKRECLENILSGKSQMVIGTHALIQTTVSYQSLGLIIVDEQHRFGVEQRRKLKNKRTDGLAVHQLVMTATPIPRTLAMTFYADLSYSVIAELPLGRIPVETAAISNDKRDQVITRVSAACNDKRQVYWVCTLVEESETLQCQAAESTATELAEQLPNVNVGLIHGRLSSQKKQQVMHHFKSGSIQLLVATTVIEVGVDVANASLMIIENPERLGLSQLHQLRGRVGRGSKQSHCVLLYQKPLSFKGRQRIEIMRETSNGFKLAEKDLKMRGPGEVLGTRQSGATLFKLADLDRDSDMIDTVVKVSDRIYQTDSATTNALIRRWCPLAKNYINV